MANGSVSGFYARTRLLLGDTTGGHGNRKRGYVTARFAFSGTNLGYTFFLYFINPNHRVERDKGTTNT